MTLKAEGLHPRVKRHAASGASAGSQIHHQKDPPFANGAQEGAPDKARAAAQSRAMWVLVRPTPSID